MEDRKLLKDAFACLCAVIVLTALLACAPRALSGKEENAVSQTESGLDVISAFLSEREQVRNLEILQLNAVAADEGAEEEIRAQARSQLLALADFMEKETVIEGVLRMRGFDGAVATVHPESVNIVVRMPSVSAQDSAAILELVMRETGQTGSHVKIMTVDP